MFLTPRLALTALLMAALAASSPAAPVPAERVRAEKERAALEPKLHGVWRAGPCEGQLTFRADDLHFLEVMATIVAAAGERERAERLERFLAAIVESTDDAVIGQTLDGTVVSWNSAAERLYGYRASERLGRGIIDLTPPERRGEDEAIREQLRRGESVRHLETVRIGRGSSSSTYAIRDTQYLLASIPESGQRARDSSRSSAAATFGSPARRVSAWRSDCAFRGSRSVSVAVRSRAIRSSARRATVTVTR